MNRQDSEIKPP